MTTGGRVHVPGDGANDVSDPGALAVPPFPLQAPRTVRQVGGFQVSTTAYGRPAVDLLARQITELKAGDPLAPVTVLVPSNYAAVSTRRALAARPGGIANVDFVTLHRLAERLSRDTRKPISAPVLAQAVRAVLADDPGVFGPVAQHPATELALVTATRELSGVSDAALDAVADCSRRARDVVRIARTVLASLRHEWHDEHDLLVAATDAVARGAPVDPVVAHLLQDLSPAGAGLLQALVTTHPVHVNLGLTGDVDADRHVLEAHARALITVGAHGVTRPRATAIISVSDPDEEVRAAVRAVTQWMRDGVRLGRVALLYGTADPYARLLHEQLSAADLPHNGNPVRDIGEMLLGRTRRSLLALPDRGFKRRDVLAVLTGAPLLSGDHHAPSRAWDRISRDAGIVDGDDWTPRLTTYAADLRTRADEAARDEQQPRAEHYRLDADRADELATFVDTLRADLTAGDAATTWTDLAAWVTTLIERYIGDDRHRVRWPEEEQQAAGRVDEAIERLAHLDAVGGPAPTVEVFRRTLDSELDVALRRVGRFGDGVLVGHVSLAVGLDLDGVVVLGMAEGAFPARRLEDSLLPDDERRAANGELRLRTDRIHDDHRQLLAAVAAADEAILCFPRGDLRRQGDRSASRWLLADVAALAGRDGGVFTKHLPAIDEPWLQKVPSFASGLVRTSFPATAQEHRLASMLRDPAPVVATDVVLARGIELSTARASHTFTRFDGNLAGLALPDHTATGVVSATRLQTWAQCPHAFFLQYLLGVEVVDEPERTLEIGALDRGSLVHEILERFIRGVIAGGRRDRTTLLAFADEVFAEYEARGVCGRPMFWRRDRARIVADLERFLVEDRGDPTHAELDFPPTAYALPDGRSVFFRGSVDRIDRTDDGLTVIDYKTGRSSYYDGLSAEDPHQRGTHLQLAIYANAARAEVADVPVEAGYWFVTAKGDFDWVGYELTPEIHAKVGTAIATIVDGIRAGVFPSHPPADKPWFGTGCDHCFPEGVHNNDARRDWERKRLDPALRAYVELSEPEVFDVDE
jgi:ATP-dependent helicase/nuclease subunit B